MLANMALTGAPETQTLSPEEARLMFSEIYRSMPPGPDDIASETIEIPVDGGRIEARILRPAVDAESIMVYYHGGGWVVGNIDDYDCARVSVPDSHARQLCGAQVGRRPSE